MEIYSNSIEKKLDDISSRVNNILHMMEVRNLNKEIEDLKVENMRLLLKLKQTTEKEEATLSCEDFWVNSEDLILKECPKKGTGISIIVPMEFCNYDFGTVDVSKFSDDLNNKVKFRGNVKLQYYMKPFKKLF